MDPAPDHGGKSGLITVLAWPARRNARLNPYNKLLYDAVEAEGTVEVREFREHWNDLEPHRNTRPAAAL